jgi:diguanylate cyclase (GGDEF)-like protein
MSPPLSTAQQRPPLSKKGRKLEPLSPAASRIVQAALQEDISVSDLANMAGSDPAFALRVLAFVNNPVLGVGRRIDSIHQAAALLGLRGLRSLALSLVITHLAPDMDGTEVLLANCLRRAVTAREIAKRMQGIAPEPCFTVGLFLDSGLLVSARADLKAAIAIANSPSSFRQIRERAAGFSMHSDVGAAVAREHFLGDEVEEAILRHHSITTPVNLLARVAWVAERVASVFEGGYYEPAREAAEEGLRYVGIPAEGLDELLISIPAAVVELSTVFDRYVGPQLEVEALRARAEESIAALTEQYESLVSSLECVVREKERLEHRLRETNGRLEELATTDNLTGLCNRQALLTALMRDLLKAERDAAGLSVLIVDLDHFGTINDAFGDALGDAVLIRVAKTLVAALRNEDVLGRFGDERFLIILPGTDRAGALIVAERIRAAVPQHAVAGPKGPISVTCSIGIAAVQGAGCRGAQESLLRRAEQALRAAKDAGRDRIIFCD